MTNKKINIFELDIDMDAVISKTSKLKKDTDILKKSLDDLKKSGDTSSDTYVKMKAAHDDLNKQYRSSQQELTKLVNLQGNEIKTISQARNALSVINKEWADQAELYGANSIEVEKLSQKKLQLTERLKELESATGDNTRNVGNYSESIKEAFGNINIFNGSIGDFISKSKETGGAGTFLKNSLTGVTQGFKALTKSTLVFIATPIGAILAVLVGAFVLVKNAMNRSEDATNKIKKAFSAFKGITNALLKILEPLGSFLIDGLVKGFELAEKAVYKGLETISKGLKLLGFDETAANLDNFNNKVQEAANVSKSLADAEAKLQKQQRESEKIQLDYQKRAEKLRQIRDDENRSTKERIFANEELGKVLKKQLQEELSIAKLALQAANLRIEAEGKTKDSLDAQAVALTKIADIQERITGQESEQLTNRVSLQKQAADKARELADSAIKEQEAQLELYIQQQGTRAKTMKEQLDIASDVFEREVEILKANLKNRNITQTEYDAKFLELKNNLLQKQAELAIDNAHKELETYIKAHQSKIEADQYFSEEALRIEQDRLNSIAEKRKEFAAKQLEQGIINQTEYNDAINLINEENQLVLDKAKAQRNEALKEKEVIDLENKRILQEQNLEYDLETQLNYLQRQKEQELAEAEAKGADLSKINDKYAQIEKQINETVQTSKLQLASDTFGNLATIAGKESAAGKAFAIAQTTIDTYQSATAAYKAMAGIPVVGPVLGGIAAAAAVASGIANVKKITSTKTPKAEQGALFDIGGNRHYAGGTKFYGEDGTQFEAEQGELIGVMNRRAAMMFKSFNDEYRGNSTSTRNYLAGGGFVQTASLSPKYSTPNNVSNFEVDYNLMTESFSRALVNMPNPITDVKDVINQVSNYNSVVNGANI